MHFYEDIASLRKLGICNFPTHRGCRGSKHRNSIPTVISSRTEQPMEEHNKVSHDNLSQINTSMFRVSVTKIHDVKVGLLNALSVKNKVNGLSDHIIETGLDIVSITETWLTHDRVTECALCTNVYDLLHTPRMHRRGGGLALLIKSNLKHSQIVSCNITDSLEYQEVHVRMNKNSLEVLLVYRPPANKKNKATVRQFNVEFTRLLEAKAISVNKFPVVGDFNFHMDDTENAGACSFTDMLQAFDLHQHVNGATHMNGHTLDLVLSQSMDELVNDLFIHDTTVSDHFCVKFTLP